MMKNITSKKVLEESVYDLIDDAAQLILSMSEGMYRDECGRHILVTRASGVTVFDIAEDDTHFIVECIQENNMGKITKMIIHNKFETKELYWATNTMIYNDCVMGERGKQMMRRLIEKLRSCTSHSSVSVVSQKITAQIHKNALKTVS